MSNPTDLPDRIGRYVRGELSDREAEAFEELYFQDDQLARLVEAEQILQQAPDLIGREHGRHESGSHGWIPRALGEPRYAYAAGIALFGILAGMLALGIHNRTLREANVRLLAAARPSVADGFVRLSAVRGVSEEEHAFTVVLPQAADRFVTLLLPVPETGAGNAGPATVRLSRRDAGESLWERDVDASALAAQLVVVNLPGGTMEPGDYAITLLQQRDAAEPITLAEYAFRVATP